MYSDVVIYLFIPTHNQHELVGILIAVSHYLLHKSKLEELASIKYVFRDADFSIATDQFI